MFQRSSKTGRSAFLAAFVAALAMTFASSARAAEDKVESSLKWVPADAGYFSTMLNLKERADAFYNSKAFAKLKAMPAVKTGLDKFHEEWNNGMLAGVKAVMAEPENQQMLQLFSDAFSNEVFILGGENWGDFSQFMSEISNSFNGMNIGGADGDAGSAQVRKMLRTLMAKSDKIQIPDLTFGFRLKDTKPAVEQIKRLEDTVKVVIGFIPQLSALKGKFKHVKVGSDDILTLQLDGSMVPWDQVPIKQIEEKPGEFDPLVKKLKALTFTMSLGVRGDYMLLAFGSSAKHLEALGGTTPRLADRPELKPLAKFSGRKLADVSYVSKALAEKLGSNAGQFDSLVQMAKSQLPQSGLSEKDQAQAVKDLEDLFKSVQENMPKPGAVLSFSMTSPNGFESYAYSYAKNSVEVGSKPLTLLSNLGGSPILGFVNRSKSDLEAYKTMTKFMEKAWTYTDKAIKAKIEAEHKPVYEKVTKAILPIISKMNEVNLNTLIPAMADGQSGLVLDAKWKSTQWHKEMPPMKSAMPMLEIGLVFGLSDTEMFLKGMSEYRKLINEACAELHKVSELNFPEITIPEPQTKKVGDTTLYFYPIPEEAGLDKQFQPTGSVGDKVAVITLSSEHTVRLLTKTPLKFKSALIEKAATENLANVVVFDWVGLMDALTPWVDHAAPMILTQAGVTKEDKKNYDEIMSEIKTVMEVLKCFKGSASVTKVEDGVTVTQMESIYVDLK